MGLKSGSRDAGLDEEGNGPAESEADEQATSQTDDTTPATSGDDESTATASGEASTSVETGESDESAMTSGSGGPDEGGSARPSVESLPYVLRRDRVNEGRDQVPFFLRDEVVDGERDLRETLEASLGEDVYKSDYREAAMVVAQEHPELVAEVLRRWGYDLS